MKFKIKGENSEEEIEAEHYRKAVNTFKRMHPEEQDNTIKFKGIDNQCSGFAAPRKKRRKVS